MIRYGIKQGESGFRWVDHGYDSLAMALADAEFYRRHPDNYKLVKDNKEPIVVIEYDSETWEKIRVIE